MLRALWVLGIVSCFALPAKAWTRAHVRDVVAEVAPRADGQLEVRLDLGLVVQGGWLERLELTGLDEGLALATEPALIDVEDDMPYPTPTATIEAGAIVLSFEKKQAPRRGAYRLLVAYTAPSDPAIGEGMFRWTLPGFQVGLERAEIRLFLPRGARPLPDPDLAYEVHAEQQAAGAQLSFVRVNVPRSLPWTVKAEVHALQPSAPAPQGKPLIELKWPRFDGYAWAVLVVFCASWGARLRLRRVAAREGLTTESVGPFGRWGLGVALLLSGFSIVLAERALPWSLAALSCVGLALLERASVAVTTEGFGQFVPADTRARAHVPPGLKTLFGRERGAPFRGAARWGLAGVFALGLVFGAGGFGGEGHSWALALACLAVPWACASSVRCPRSTAERLAHLVRAASTLELSGGALRLVWFVRPGHAPTDPRLRITTAVPYPGVLRIEVLSHPARGHVPLVLSVVASAGSVAEGALRERWTEAVCVRSQGGKRTAFLVPVEDLGQALEALLAMLSSYSQRVLEGRIAARDAA